MTIDVIDLRDFYSQRLGIVARRLINRGIHARWPNAQGQRVLGLGYPTPYLGLFREHEPDLPTVLSHQQILILGEPGAGKSTTIKMLTGILVPTAGHVEVGGLVPWRDREHNALNIGVVFGQRTQLWWDLPAWDSFLLNKEIDEIPQKQFDETVAIHPTSAEGLSFPL